MDRDTLRIGAFLTIWMVCWFGGWIAGGLMFPAYETPAEIGAFLGFWGGLFGGGLLTRMDRVGSGCGSASKVAPPPPPA